MSRVKKKILLISLVGLALVISFFCFCFRKEMSAILATLYDMTPAKQQLYQDVREKIRIVELGMTKGKVEQIMGSPINVVDYEFENKKCEIWYFPDSRVASEPSRCIFNKDTEKVVMVVSGDEYYLREK